MDVKYDEISGGVKATFSQQADKVIITIEYKTFADAYIAMRKLHERAKTDEWIYLRFPVAKVD
jgi:hypothetical protein